MHDHSWFSAPWFDLFAGIVDVIAIAEDVDVDACDPGDRDRVGGSFSGLNLPANTAPDPALSEKWIFRVAMYGGRIAFTWTIRRQELA